MTTKMRDLLEVLYTKEVAHTTFERIAGLLKGFSAEVERRPGISHKDAIIITYADQIVEEGKMPLESLQEFADSYLAGIVSSIHILPFYPYSSDDGFSVIDYWQVKREFGTWQDVQRLASHFDLMFDGVINHISAHSEWFKEYLKGSEIYREYFIEADPSADYAQVTRPRTLPLLSKFDTAMGERNIWTTFSADQVDLNYHNPEVLIKIVELLLFYVAMGARFLRLDAIGYIWKKLGTNCIHLPEAHAIIQLLRLIFEETVPGTILITETNVPHADNISYFGNGYNEAQMVYQFPLPPLVLHTFTSGNVQKLREWANGIKNPSLQATYFNFLASHDGIGLMPARGILSDEEIENLVQTVTRHGGFVSYKSNGDGTKSPYELNISYINALSSPEAPVEMKVKRMVAAHSILLALAGVPGVYIHSILGSENDRNGALKSGINRRINREKLDKSLIAEELQDQSSLRGRVFAELTNLLRHRREHESFDPWAPQKVLDLGPAVFGVVRGTGTAQILCVTNVTDSKQIIVLSKQQFPKISRDNLINLLRECSIRSGGDSLTIELQPYQVSWLT